MDGRTDGERPIQMGARHIRTYYVQPNARITAGQKWLLAEYVRVGKNPVASC